MRIPFIFGKIAQDENFTDRENDHIRLSTNLLGGVNTVIISPRRWGKSSLVNNVLKDISDDSDYIVCHIDAFDCRSEEQFYAIYVESILRACATKTEEILRLVKRYVSSFGPKFTFGNEDSGQVSVSIDIHDRNYSIEEIIDLPQHIAAERGKKMIVCIDEFQNVAQYDDSEAFQKKLRSHWQRHTDVTYCLYGSKRHMLIDIFNTYERPFYKFGDIIMLPKIALDKWIPFITERFAATGKYISESQAGTIAERMRCHPYYVQQYSQLVWLLTENSVEDATIDNALEQLMDRCGLLMNSIIDDLRPRQYSFLKAIANGEKNLTSASTLTKYNLGSSANVKNLRKSLMDKDLIDVSDEGTLVMQDPLLECFVNRKR